jgi:hypothetical protein
MGTDVNIPSSYMPINFSKQFKIGWEKNIKQSWLNKIRGACNHGLFIPRLYHRCINTRDRIGAMNGNQTQ